MSTCVLLPTFVLSLSLLVVLAPYATAEDAPRTRSLTDFGAASSLAWYTVNDNVMGGRSSGGFAVLDGKLVFSGSTNTNGGGFSSIRTREQAMDLSGFEGIRLRVRADGRRYTFRLTTSEARYGRYAIPYRAEFDTVKGDEWQVFELPFSGFRPRWRGRSISAPALDPALVESLGLMIYDKQDGPFRLEVDWIQAYRAGESFRLAQYRGERRPLLVFAPSADDPRLLRQVADVATTRALFDERAMVLVVVAGEGDSRVEGDALSAADAEALRAEYGVAPDGFAVRLVGKDGTVKASDDEVVPMASIYDRIDAMPMRQREVSGR